jgi:tetratricopeptide (TPR) repeat protein
VKAVPALIVLAAGLAAFGGEADRSGVREVRVRVLADEEVRAEPGWRDRVSSLMAAVSGEYERLFGLRFVLLGFDGWLSDDSLGSLELLLDALDATASKEGCDALLALTAQKGLAPGTLGYSLFKEGIVLVLFTGDAPGLERTLKHEWGHIFGGAHMADRKSIMNRLLLGSEFDALTSRAIRLSRDRTFNGVDFPIPKGSRRQAVDLYREICDANIRTVAAAAGSVADTAAAGVTVSGELRALDDAHFLLAGIHLEEKEYDEAWKECLAALELDPGNLETMNLMGIIARRQGRVDEAIRTYEKVLGGNPRSARYLYNMGIAYAKKGEAGKAMDLYRRALELKPNFAEAWNNVGELGLRAGRLGEAEEAFRKALAINGGFALAHSNLAEVYVGKKEYDKALAEIDLAVRLGSGLPFPYNVRGNLLFARGRTAEAAAEYAKAIAIDPAYEKAHYNLGICRLEEGGIADAMSHFSKAVELAPHLAEARAGLGYCLLQTRKVDEGIAEIRRAQELGLVSARTHLNLSYAFLLKNRPGEAVEEALRAIGLDPALAQGYNNLGIAYTNQGLTREAEEAFGKAVELDPGYKDSLANLAGLLAALGKRREAIGRYLEAIAIDPKDGVLHNNIAVLYFKEGAVDKAREHARKAVALGVKVDPGFLEELEKKGPISPLREGPAFGYAQDIPITRRTSPLMHEGTGSGGTICAD